MIAAFVLAFAALPSVAASPRDLVPVLRSLDAADAGERARAERWLVEGLAGGDLAELRAGLAQVDLGPEAGWRLSRALGSRGTNLGLVLDLLVGAGARTSEPVSLDLDFLPDSDAPTRLGREREIARRALEHGLATWHSGLERMPLSGAALAPMLREERERAPWKPLRITDGPVADFVARLVREGDLPIPVVLAQGLADRLTSERFGGGYEMREQPFSGPWDTVLLDFVRSHDLALEAVLVRGEEGVDDFAWLRIVAREEAGKQSGAAQVTRALEDVARFVAKPDDARRGDVDEFAPSISTAELQLAARFLAGIGWDAALGWLGDLYLEQDLAIARTALLDAAARGFVEPRLTSLEAFDALWAWAEGVARGAGGGRAHLERFEAALVRFPRFGLAGDDLLGRAFDAGAPGWVSGEPERRAAWAALARVRFAFAAALGELPEAGVELAGDVLAAGDVPRADASKPRLPNPWPGDAANTTLDLAQLAALRALALRPAPELAPLRWERVYSWVPDLIHADELAPLLAAQGHAPPIERGRHWLPREARLALVTNLLVADLPGDAPPVPDGFPAPPAGTAPHEGARAAANLIADLGFLEFGSWSRLLANGADRERFDALAAGLETLWRDGHGTEVLRLFDTLTGYVIASVVSGDVDEAGQTEPPAHYRLALVLGLATQDPALLDRLAGREAGSPRARASRLDYPFLDDLEVQGADSYLAHDREALALLAASGAPRAERARELLFEHFEGALQAPEAHGVDLEMLHALERAVQALWARGADAEADALILDIAMQAASYSGHPLARRILFQAWPPPIR